MDAFKTPEIPQPKSTISVPDVDLEHMQFVPEIYENIEPVDLAEDRGINPVLDSLGIEDSLENVSGEDKDSIVEINQYVKSIMETKHIKSTLGNFHRVFDGIKEELGMDGETEPYAVIDKIGGMVRSWRDLGFIADPHEKRIIFMKLAKCKDSKDMHNLIFKEMDTRRVYG